MGAIAHCGGRKVPRHELDLIPVPVATKTYQPIPHGLFADKILQNLERAGYEERATEYIVSADGNQFFGYTRLNRPETEDFGYGAAVGFRSSYNKTLPVGLSGGSDVFVCDNLAFSGSFTLFRRHTPLLLEDIDFKIWKAIEQLAPIFMADDRRFEAYKATIIDQPMADHLINTCIRKGVVPVNEGTKLIREWYEPSHAEHTQNGNTVWRMFNAATEALKSNAPSNLALLPKRTENLQRLLDNYVELPLAA